MRCAILGTCAVGLLIGAGSSAHAQTPAAEAPAPAMTASTAAAPAPAVPAGSPVMVELAEPVSSRTAKPGDMFAIRLVTPITLEGRVLAPSGTMGQGQIVDAGRTGALGRPAKLVLAARYIKIDDARVGLKAFRLGAAGRDNSNAIMVAGFVPYVGVLALFMQGGEIDIPAGTIGQAKLVADLSAPLPITTPPVAADPANPS